jgi:hypothetical protein
MTRVVLRIASLLLLAATAHAQTTTIELLDAGAQPRAPLRYKFTAGSVERGTLEMSMSLQRETNGQYVPVVTMPPVRMTMELRVTEVTADGAARVEMTTRSAEAAVDQGTGVGQGDINSALATVSRLGGWYTMDTRGRTTAGEASLRPMTGASATAQGRDTALTQAINNEMNNQLPTDASMFPEEPVGKGARWRVTTRSPVATLDAATSSEYTLLSRQGNRIELDMKMGLTASGSSPQGVSVAAGAAATGHSVIDLDKLVHTMTVQADSDMQGTNAPGQPAAMRTQMRMTVTPEPN